MTVLFIIKFGSGRIKNRNSFEISSPIRSCVNKNFRSAIKFLKFGRSPIKSQPIFLITNIKINFGWNE